MKVILGLLCIVLFGACASIRSQKQSVYVGRASQLLDCIVKYYQAEQADLFNENYPDDAVAVTYLALQDTVTHN